MTDRSERSIRDRRGGLVMDEVSFRLCSASLEAMGNDSNECGSSPERIQEYREFLRIVYHVACKSHDKKTSS